MGRPPARAGRARAPRPSRRGAARRPCGRPRREERPPRAPRRGCAAPPSSSPAAPPSPPPVPVHARAPARAPGRAPAFTRAARAPAPAGHTHRARRSPTHGATIAPPPLSPVASARHLGAALGWLRPRAHGRARAHRRRGGRYPRRAWSGRNGGPVVWVEKGSLLQLQYKRASGARAQDARRPGGARRQAAQPAARQGQSRATRATSCHSGQAPRPVASKHGRVAIVNSAHARVQEHSRPSHRWRASLHRVPYDHARGTRVGQRSSDAHTTRSCLRRSVESTAGWDLQRVVTRS